MEESPDRARFPRFLPTVIRQRIRDFLRPEVAALRRSRKLLALSRIVPTVFLGTFRACFPHLSRNVWPVVSGVTVRDRARIHASSRLHRCLGKEFLRDFIPQRLQVSCHKLRCERRAKLVKPILIVVFRSRLATLRVYGLRPDYAVEL